MSSEQSPSRHTPMNEWEVRAALKLAGLTQKQVAKDLETTQSYVADVIKGRKWQGSVGRQIMEYVAQAIGVPVEVAFPHSERRKRPFPDGIAA
jgi:transcriptional regulator with XRE-family HTH domain